MQFHRVANKAPSTSLADFPALSGSSASGSTAAVSAPVAESISPDLSKLIELCDENIAAHFKKKGKVAPYNATARFPSVLETKKAVKLLQSSGLSTEDAINKIVDGLKTKYHHHIQKDGSHYLDTRPSNRPSSKAKNDDGEDGSDEDGATGQVTDSLNAVSLSSNAKVGSGVSSASVNSITGAASTAAGSFWAGNALASKRAVGEAEFGLTANHTDSAIALRELTALCRTKVERFDFKKGKDRFDATLSFEKVFQTKQGTDLLAASGLGTEAAVDQIVHAVKGDFFAFVDNSHYFLALERPPNVAKKTSINDMRLDTSKKKLTK